MIPPPQPTSSSSTSTNTLAAGDHRFNQHKHDSKHKHKDKKHKHKDKDKNRDKHTTDQQSSQNDSRRDPHADHVRDASPTRVSHPAPPVTFDPNKRRPFQCKFCNGRFLSTHLWKNHVDQHNNEPDSIPQYECSVCCRKFLYESARDHHCSSHHPDVFIPPIPADPITAAAAASGKSSAGFPLKRQPDRADVTPDVSREKKKKLKVNSSSRKNHKDPVSDKRPVSEKKQSATNRKQKDATYKDPGHVRIHRNFSPSEVLAGVPIPGHLMRREPENGKDFTERPDPVRTCRACSQQFSTTPEYDFHYPCYEYTKFRVTNGYKCFKCKDSSYIYPDLKELQIHALDHSIPKFECLHCDTKKFMLFEIKVHISQAHPKMLKVAKRAEEQTATNAATSDPQQQLCENVPCNTNEPLPAPRQPSVSEYVPP